MVDQYPENFKLLYGLALTYHNNKMYEHAIRYYEKVI